MKQEVVHHATRPSTIVTIIAWGTAGYMALPGLWSWLIHFFMLPLLLAAALWFRHLETKHAVKKVLQHRT